MNNQQWQLARPPAGGLPAADDFRWLEGPMPSPGPGQMLTETLYLSLDPYQWGRRRRGDEKPGEVCHGRTVSRVVSSRLEGYADGDYVFNTNGWQHYGLTGDGISVFGYMYPRKLDPSLAPISTAVGVLGMLGLTAYAGLIVQCAPRPGETVVVSAASGGVGQIVGQLARIKGCRVVGIAGAGHKCDYVTQALGFDACVSHLDEALPEQLNRACPDGIDIYFENVGGRVFEAVLPLLSTGSRVTRCGLVSQYGNTGDEDAAAVWLRTGQPWFERQATTVHSLTVRHFVDDYQDRFLAEMAAWMKDGHIKYREDLWTGLERAPEAFSAMLNGGNFGKTLVSVGEDPTLDESTRARRAAGNTLA
ncbi:MAG: NADP-dependent oxidoreductase [Gammaproteobacteria bacterium]|nr:NADP-dependent oxidoreductase [Gammaproteobacteria bacterium]